MATAGCYKNGATAGMLLRRGVKRRKVNGERCESSLVSVVYTDRRPLEKAADDNLLVCCSQSIRDIAIDL